MLFFEATPIDYIVRFVRVYERRAPRSPWDIYFAVYLGERGLIQMQAGGMR